jgi:hypothetical protein
MRGRGRGARAALHAFCACGLLLAVAAEAAPVRIFRTQSAEAFLRGEVEGVAIEASGVLTLAPEMEKVADLDEPFAFALARRQSGWAIGTGNDGRVLEIGDDGGVRELFDAPEPEIFALWSDVDGTLFAGSSPNGKVYRIGRDGAQVELDPEETYVWAIARGSDGTLWVATGGPGRLYRVPARGKSELVWDAGATHVRSLLPLPGGEMLVGTAGDGRLLRWSDGRIRTLYDSELTEVVAMAAAPDGAVWAALLASEASFVDLAPRPAGGGEEGEGSRPVVTVEEGAPAGSRPPGTRGPRSELVRVLPNGAVEKVWSSSDETIFSLLADGERLWFGTGLGGRLYRVESGRARVERELDGKQIVGLVSGRHGPTALTTNASALWRATARTAARGTYASPALDAGQAARFGVFRWQGEALGKSSVRVSFRSGFSSEPDATWSPWSAPRAGSEVALDAAERGRFVQYRLELASGGGASPRVVATELSYRQENLRPAIDAFFALEPGQILVPAGFNPAEQLFEPVSPNRQGIFETLRPTPPREERLRTVWRRGWRTLRWDASDPNGDDLRFRLEVRPEGSAGGWMQIADELSERSYPFDATALPDGLYRFRLTATDAPSNEEGEALTSERESEPVLVDHTPPALVRVARSGSELRVVVEDSASPLRSAELSIDGGAWKPLAPLDGLLDGRREELVVRELPAAAKLVLLRAADAAFNVVTFDLLAELAR